MPNTPDEIIDRRRLRRKLTFWRVAAIVIAAIAIAGAAFGMFADQFGATAQDHIAKVRIEGTITEDDELLKRLEAIRKSKSVKGVIMAVNSPGGTTAASSVLPERIRSIRPPPRFPAIMT